MLLPKIVEMRPAQLSLDKVTSSNVNYEFVANVSTRFIKILFRTDKKIKLIYSNYSNKHFLGGNVVILNYRFRNALWYKIDDITTDKRQFVVAKPEFTKRMELTVYGFFTKKKFTLNFTETSQIDNNSFCIEQTSEYSQIQDAILY